MPLANSTFNNRVTQSSPLAVNVSFQFIDVWDFDMIDSLLIMLNKWQIFNDFVVSQWFLSRCMRTQYEFNAVNGHTTTSAFHKVV